MANRASSDDGESRLRTAMETIRRAFAEFLTIPTAVIVGFLALSAFAYYLDRLRIARDWPSVVAGSHESVTTLLGTIATSIVTVTSITFSLLLIAVQQSAAALTGQVYDQFLRRRANQAYFGFFIGLALYCLVILSTVRADYTPVYGAAIAFGLTVVALYMLVLLIYASVDQMRPVAIIGNIREHALKARKQQMQMLSKTRQTPAAHEGASVRLPAPECGFITDIDVPRLEHLRSGCEGMFEIVLMRSVGDYMSIGEPLLELRYTAAPPDERIGEQLVGAVRLEKKRDLGTDPGFAIEQMVNIAWTTGSSSKQNPHPARLACRSLRDLVAHWYRHGQDDIERGGDQCRIVVADHVPRDLVRALETLTVVASEGMQHQTLAEAYRALELALHRTTGELHREVEDVIMRSLATLGDNPLTAELDLSIRSLMEALPPGGTRIAVKRARDRLAETHGVLNSRSTRVKNPLGTESGS